MTWFYRGEIVGDEIVDGYTGFVYTITDKVNGMQYIGKKRLKSIRKIKPLKGQKFKRTKIAPSDWQDYFGSGEAVKALVAEHGPERFYREINRLCSSTAEMSYYELKLQMDNDVLLHPDKFYNGFVGAKIHRNHLKHLVVKTSAAIEVPTLHDTSTP